MAFTVGLPQLTPDAFAVTHKIYGVPQTINSSNYVYFLAYQELFKLRESEPCADQPQKERELDRIVTEELLNLHRGQGLDLFWRDSLTCPTEDEYIGMVNNSESPPVWTRAFENSSRRFQKPGDCSDFLSS